MNLETWQAENGRYLAASLEWLRLRLTQLADEPASQRRPVIVVAAKPKVAPVKRSFWSRLFGNGGEPAPADVAPESEEPKPDWDPGMKQAMQAREEAAKMQPPPALLLLADQLQLKPFERDVLLLCAAMELDTRIPGLCARANGSAEQAHPTFALALSALGAPAWEALSPHRPLRYWRLIEVNAGPSQSLTSAPLKADERIVHYIKGLNSLDERLGVLLSRVEAGGGAEPPASQKEKAEYVVARLQNAPSSEPLPVPVMLGPDVSAKLIVAQWVASRLKRQLYRLGIESLPSQQGETSWLARLWQRESALMPISLYIDAQGDGAGPETWPTLDRFVERAVRSDSIVMLGSREPLARMSFAGFTFDVGRPTALEQEAEWAAALAAVEEEPRKEIARRLSSQYSLNAPEIRRTAESTPAEPGETLGQRLWDACRDRSRPRLETLAQRIDPRATWNDLVVAEETLGLLREIVAQTLHRGTVYEEWGFARRMNRGLGISALFAGESGTGKTMAAEVIANELRLALYRIDLAQVVSKYIGETEKNLQRVFDLMEGGGAILFFDEADALFGKRSEVRDSHDRYANIEINYLLQRMESYTGLAILATNMKSALDTAFMRRLRFIVPFQFPGPAERRQMWEKTFPEDVPKDALDYERLARLHCTGASIHSIALNAAFLAAKEGKPVTMPAVLTAARSEFRKLERPVSEADLKVQT